MPAHHNSSNGYQAHGVKLIPFTFNSANANASASQLVLALFPQWKEGEGELELTTFKDGITNTVRQADVLVYEY